MDSTWAAQYRITSDPVICSTCYVDADWGVCNPSAHPHPQGIDAACDAQAHAIARGTPAGLRNLLRQ